MNISNFNSIQKEFKSITDLEKAKIFSRFFKTGKGQYGYGDLFLGVNVPTTRSIAHKHFNTSFTELEKVLKSKYHEIRLCGLLILVKKFINATKEKDTKAQSKIYNFYIRNTKKINNWDLVDLSCYQTVGEFCYKNNKDNEIIQLVKSSNMWEKRIGIVSAYAYIKNKNNKLIFKIAKMVLNDKNDLIQKATGWMLRESGKRVSKEDLITFLKENHKKMSRTMFRYSVEKLSKEEIKEIEKKQV